MALRWYGDQAMAALRADARNKVRSSCLLTERTIKASMTKGGRTESGTIDPVTGGKAEKIGTYRSAAGEVPRVQTGTLRRSYTHELHPTLPIGRVGTNLPYGKFLEFGTRKMAARPHVWPALVKLAGMYRKLFGIPIVTGGIGVGSGG